MVVSSPRARFEFKVRAPRLDADVGNNRVGTDEHCMEFEIPLAALSSASASPDSP
jgi:hypothetical protein